MDSGSGHSSNNILNTGIHASQRAHTTEGKSMERNEVYASSSLSCPFDSSLFRN